MSINQRSKVTTFVTEETRKMSDEELLEALKDLHAQWDDYELCFDVESYERELKEEMLKRGIRLAVR